MTLSQYIESLQNFAKAHPEAADLTLVKSEDHGNWSYAPVEFDPIRGYYNKRAGEFTSKDVLEHHINAIWI